MKNDIRIQKARAVDCYCLVGVVPSEIFEGLNEWFVTVEEAIAWVESKGFKVNNK